METEEGDRGLERGMRKEAKPFGVETRSLFGASTKERERKPSLELESGRVHADSRLESDVRGLLSPLPARHVARQQGRQPGQAPAASSEKDYSSSVCDEQAAGYVVLLSILACTDAHAPTFLAEISLAILVLILAGNAFVSPDYRLETHYTPDPSFHLHHIFSRFLFLSFQNPGTDLYFKGRE